MENRGDRAHGKTTFFSNDLNRDAVANLIEKSKFFIEWTAVDTGSDRVAELVELQVQLARWQLNWLSLWADREQRVKVAEQAKNWSDRVLEMAGISFEMLTFNHSVL